MQNPNIITMEVFRALCTPSIRELMPGANSGLKRTGIPEQSGQSFRTKADTYSGRKRTLIPDESGHFSHDICAIEFLIKMRWPIRGLI